MNKIRIEASEITKPPVIEAIIAAEFSVPEEPINPKNFEDLVRMFSIEFPIVKPPRGHEPKTLRPTYVAPMSAPGVRLQSSEEDSYLALSIQINKISVSAVGQYCGGDKLIGLFERVFVAYTKMVDVTDPIRIGMRYINKVCYDAEELEKKLTILPTLPELDTPVMLNSMFYASSIADQELRNKANLAYFFEALGNIDGKDCLNLIIDIDAFQEISDTGLDMRAVMQRLESIREFKNYLFTSTFTDKGLEDFR